MGVIISVAQQKNCQPSSIDYNFRRQRYKTINN